MGCGAERSGSRGFQQAQREAAGSANRASPSIDPGACDAVPPRRPPEIGGSYTRRLPAQSGRKDGFSAHDPREWASGSPELLSLEGEGRTLRPDAAPPSPAGLRPAAARAVTPAQVAQLSYERRLSMAGATASAPDRPGASAAPACARSARSSAARPWRIAGSTSPLAHPPSAGRAPSIAMIRRRTSSRIRCRTSPGYSSTLSSRPQVRRRLNAHRFQSPGRSPNRRKERSLTPARSATRSGVGSSPAATTARAPPRRGVRGSAPSVAPCRRSAPTAQRGPRDHLPGRRTTSRRCY